MRSHRTLRGAVARAQRARRPVVVVVEHGEVRAPAGAPPEVLSFARDLRAELAMATLRQRKAIEGVAQVAVEQLAAATLELQRMVEATVAKAAADLAVRIAALEAAAPAAPVAAAATTEVTPSERAAWKREKLARIRAAEKAAAQKEVAAELADAVAEAAHEAVTEAAAIAEAERADAAFEARRLRDQEEASIMQGDAASMHDSGPSMHDSAPALAPLTIAQPPRVLRSPTTNLNEVLQPSLGIPVSAPRTVVNQAATAPAKPALDAADAEFRRQVQARRQAEGLSWDALARQLDVERGTLTGWMSGGRGAAVEAALRAWLATPIAPRMSTATEATPPAPGTLQAVPATLRTAQDWLYEELLREKGKRTNHDEIEQQIAAFTPRGLFAEVNRRRLAHGLSPYALDPRAA